MRRSIRPAGQGGRRLSRPPYLCRPAEATSFSWPVALNATNGLNMNPPAFGTPERSWSQDPPEGCHTGGATVQVSDTEVWISIDHIRCENYHCDLADYLTEERGPGRTNHRDIVKTLLAAEEVLAVAEEVRSRLAKRPL